MTDIDSNKRRSAYALACLTTCCFANPSLAQGMLEQVTVTAQKLSDGSSHTH